MTVQNSIHIIPKILFLGLSRHTGASLQLLLDGIYDETNENHRKLKIDVSQGK